MKETTFPLAVAFQIALAAGSLLSLQAAETVWLNSLDLRYMRQGNGKPQVNRSIREQPLSIGGQKFEHGVGTHANSALWLDLGGGTERFQATVGLDDAAGNGSVSFTILGDGKKLFDSGTMKPGQPGKIVDLDLKGVHTLLLKVGDAEDGISFDHADWAEARFLVSGAKPSPIRAPAEEKGDSHAQAAGPAAHQWPHPLWLPAGQAFPLPDSGHRPAADAVCRGESARRPAT